MKYGGCLGIFKKVWGFVEIYFFQKGVFVQNLDQFALRLTMIVKAIIKNSKTLLMNFLMLIMSVSDPEWTEYVENAAWCKSFVHKYLPVFHLHKRFSFSINVHIEEEGARKDYYPVWGLHTYIFNIRPFPKWLIHKRVTATYRQYRYFTTSDLINWRQWFYWW